MAGAPQLLAVGGAAGLAVYLLNRDGNSRLVKALSGTIPPDSGANDTEHARRMASFSKTGSAAGMRASEFCVVPKGDTPTSSRLYSAIACGCVPLIIADHIRPHLAFSRAVDFERFVAFVPEGEFGRDPVAAVSNVTSHLAPRLESIRDAMEAAGPDLLLEYEPSSRSRVVDHLLAEWRSDCEQPATTSSMPE